MRSIEKHPLPLLDPVVFERLTGVITRDPVPVVDVPPDGNCVRISMTNPQKPPREFEILEQSRDFAVRLGDLVERLYREGNEPGSVSIGIDANGEPIAKPRQSSFAKPPTKRTRPTDSKTSKVSSVSCELPNGLRLAMLDSSGRLGIHAVGDVLAEALKHFKARVHLDMARPFIAPYRRWAFDNANVLGTIELATSTPHELTPALWVEGIIFAHSRLTTVEHILLSLKRGGITSDLDSAYLRMIEDAAAKAGGDLLAVAAVINHDMKQYLHRSAANFAVEWRITGVFRQGPFTPDASNDFPALAKPFSSRKTLTE